MDEEEKKNAEEQQEHEQDQDAQPRSVTRRQFLVGAGAGLVVGAAGAAGVIAVVAPKPGQPAIAVSQPPAQSGGPIAVAEVAEVDERLITLKVNGQFYQLVAKARATLSDVLRYELGLTGAHVGCNRGECGTCTVVMDGKDVYSCSVMAFAAEGHEITTVEGLPKNTASLEGLHPIQRQFALNDGGQCNFCVPGQIMSAYALLQRNKNPTEDDIRRNQSGNICRCGNYQHIRAAILAAAKEMGGSNG